MSVRRWWPTLLVGFALGLTTVFLIDVVGSNGVGPTWGKRVEYLLLPGAVLGMVVSSEGVHGSSPMLWLAAAICGNVLFYAAVWVLVLVLIGRHRRAAGRLGSPS